MPNELGISKNPCFCLKRSKKNKNNLEDETNDVNIPLNRDLEDNNIEHDFSSAIFHEKINNEQNLKRTIKIRNLEKEFGELKAVNGISLCLYESQIFCLLGHNGAGKTTTINLLTGLIEKTKGKVSIYDKDLDEDIDLIRNSIGLCIQKDLLYKDFTVEEHLSFIGAIKGLNASEIDQQIEYILPKVKNSYFPIKIFFLIIKCCLASERNKFSQNLSGGNKRKLSLAMALMGDSKVIFLDEPTSGNNFYYNLITLLTLLGMDPVTRRTIWEILEIIRKENRTITLTTHHLEEAEYLSDRIGIMAKGKIIKFFNIINISNIKFHLFKRKIADFRNIKLY